MDLLSTSRLFDDFLAQRRYLKNVTPSTIEWYETAFKAVQRTHGVDPVMSKAAQAPAPFKRTLLQQGDLSAPGREAVMATARFRAGWMPPGNRLPLTVSLPVITPPLQGGGTVWNKPKNADGPIIIVAKYPRPSD